VQRRVAVISLHTVDVNALRDQEQHAYANICVSQISIAGMYRTTT